MGFTTIYEFLDSVIENTRAYVFPVKDAEKFSLQKDRPEGVATAPLLKPGPASLTGTQSLLGLQLANPPR